MRIPVDQVEDSPKHLHYAEDVADLNARLERGTCDFQIPGALDVDLDYYRAGADIYFDGTLHGDARATCARCCEEFVFPLDAPVKAVLAPRADVAANADEPDDDDLGLSFYEGDEIDVTALVHEQVILALPTRALCAETCRGLCARCGANLNAGPCSCPATDARSPFASLAAQRRAT